jgi:hypothetical protein
MRHATPPPRFRAALARADSEQTVYPEFSLDFETGDILRANRHPDVVETISSADALDRLAIRNSTAKNCLQ